MRKSIAYNLYGKRQRRVVDVAREDMDDAREVLDAELPAHVVDQVGQRRTSERAQSLMRRTERRGARAKQHLV